MKQIISTKGYSWCYGCKKHLPVVSFTKDKRRYNGLSQLCKKCALQHARHYYKKNQKEYQHYKANAVLYLGNKCKRCGKENLPLACFAFHHRNTKNKESKMYHLLVTKNWSKIRLELDKCDLMCCNCHQIIHHGIITAIS